MARFVATSYPLLDAFWTILWIFGFFIWVWLLIAIFGDIFRSHDLSGWGKALWVIVIIIFPLFGVLIYLIVRGGKMQERQAAVDRQQEAQVRDYIREAAGTAPNSADQLSRLASLRDQGVLTQDEFQREKAKIVG